ncbi:hypothetical protein [Chengkuizengella marina]|uniref:Uncharacterized protein n=1 Tax=Chengkuizengella marina TaxID=2507566 RepID=A0A6N9Q015_9BACL|nr:hypothetical protein [Chengkuizengella marina]NBI28587.1 hypothetical protein [Chengkuizengella marina]
MNDLRAFSFQWENGVDYVITRTLNEAFGIIHTEGMGYPVFYEAINTYELDEFKEKEPALYEVLNDINPGRLHNTFFSLVNVEEFDYYSVYNTYTI